MSKLSFNPNNPNLPKLIKALRSGEFEQIRGRLRRGDAFCCLGVACELYRREHPQTCKWSKNKLDFLEISLDNSLHPFSEMLPPLVAIWFGVGERNFIDYDAYKNAMAMNDKGKTFSEIADWLESFIPPQKSSP